MLQSKSGRPTSGKDNKVKQKTMVIRVSEENYNELVKIAGIIQLATGKKITLDEAVGACIETYPMVNVSIREAKQNQSSQH